MGQMDDIIIFMGWLQIHMHSPFKNLLTDSIVYVTT